MTNYSVIFLDIGDPNPISVTVGWAVATDSVNEGSGTYSAILTLAAPAAYDLDITYARSGGDAVPGVDLNVTPPPIRITAGDISAAVPIEVLQNDSDLDSKDIELTIQGVTPIGNAVITGTAVDPLADTFLLTIQNTTAVFSGVVGFETNTSSFPETDGVRSIRIDTNGVPAPVGGVTIGWSASGTAVEGVNYSWITDPADDLVIAEGETFVDIQFDPLVVAGSQADVDLILTVDTIDTGVLGQDTHTSTLTDVTTTATVDLSPANQSVPEGLVSPNPFQVNVNITGGSNPDGSANYTIMVPYTRVGGIIGHTLLSPNPLVIPPGTTTMPILMETIPNSIPNTSSMTLTVDTADAAFNATAGSQIVSVTQIVNQDISSDLPVVSFVEGTQQLDAGGSVSIRVKLSKQNDTGAPAFVEVVPHAWSTAEAGTHYTAFVTTLAFLDGEDEATLTINTTAASVSGMAMHLYLDLESPLGLVVSNHSRYIVTIKDPAQESAAIPARQTLSATPDITVTPGNVTVNTGPGAGTSTNTTNEIGFAILYARGVWDFYHGPNGTISTHDSPSTPDTPQGVELRPVVVHFVGTPENNDVYASHSYPSSGGGAQGIGSGSSSWAGENNLRDIAFVGVDPDRAVRLRSTDFSGAFDNLRFENVTFHCLHPDLGQRQGISFARGTRYGRIKFYDVTFLEHEEGVYPNGLNGNGQWTGIEDTPFGVKFYMRGVSPTAYDIRNCVFCAAKEHSIYMQGGNGQNGMEVYIQDTMTMRPGTGRTFNQNACRRTNTDTGGTTPNITDDQQHASSGDITLDNCHGYHDMDGLGPVGAVSSVFGAQVFTVFMLQDGTYRMYNCSSSIPSTDIAPGGSLGGSHGGLIFWSANNALAVDGFPPNQPDWMTTNPNLPLPNDVTGPGFRQVGFAGGVIDGYTFTHFNGVLTSKDVLNFNGIGRLEIRDFKIRNMQPTFFLERQMHLVDTQALGLGILGQERGDFGEFIWGPNIVAGPAATYAGWFPNSRKVGVDNGPELSASEINSIPADVPFFPPGTPPTAILASDEVSGNAPLTVVFTNQTSDPFQIAYITYDDGTGQVITTNRTHTFDTAGDYTVTLEVQGVGGRTTDTVQVTVTTGTSGNPQPILFDDTGPNNPGAIPASDTFGPLAGAPLDEPGSSSPKLLINDAWVAANGTTVSGIRADMGLHIRYTGASGPLIVENFRLQFILIEENTAGAADITVRNGITTGRSGPGYGVGVNTSSGQHPNASNIVVEYVESSGSEVAAWGVKNTADETHAIFRFCRMVNCQDGIKFLGNGTVEDSFIWHGQPEPIGGDYHSDPFQFQSNTATGVMRRCTVWTPWDGHPYNANPLPGMPVTPTFPGTNGVQSNAIIETTAQSENTIIMDECWLFAGIVYSFGISNGGPGFSWTMTNCHLVDESLNGFCRSARPTLGYGNRFWGPSADGQHADGDLIPLDYQPDFLNTQNPPA